MVYVRKNARLKFIKSQSGIASYIFNLMKYVACYLCCINRNTEKYKETKCFLFIKISPSLIRCFNN